jgi:DNA-binding MarR family transcriptional regulator
VGTIRPKSFDVKKLDIKISNAILIDMKDLIDRMIDCWKRELPDLDPSPLHLVGRVIVLAQHLERSVNAALARHELNLGLFDILATLRRVGPDGKLTPTQLSKSLMLSSGGMTNRLDRLETAGWIERLRDPDDRRGTLVALTPSGREVIEVAAKTRFEEAEEAMPQMDAKDRKALTGLLREWLGQAVGSGD